MHSNALQTRWNAALLDHESWFAAPSSQAIYELGQTAVAAIVHLFRRPRLAIAFIAIIVPQECPQHGSRQQADRHLLREDTKHA